MKLLDESIVDGKRLGRHIEHDPRSRAFAFGAIVDTSTLISVIHRRYGSVLNQGNVGSCTGNATAHAINTKGLHVAHSHLLKEEDALSIYELATQLDDIPGEYPASDTGSSGLAAAKAAQQKGLIKSYSHAFSIAEALTALQVVSVITGVSWYEGFDNPDPTGLVTISGQVRGGHEFEIKGLELRHTLEDSLVIAQNSWGKEWGRHGQFTFTVRDWSTLLDQEGDVTILT